MVILTIFLPKFLHNTVHFLTLTGQTETWKHTLERFNIGYTIEVEGVNVLVENFLIQINIFSKVLTYFSLVKGRGPFQKVNNTLDLSFQRFFRNETFKNQIGDSIFRLQIKLDWSFKHFILLKSCPLNLVYLINLLLTLCHHIRLSHLTLLLFVWVMIDWVIPLRWRCYHLL